MITGIGVDVVDIARFERALDRTPGLRERLFAESERSRPTRSLAARFAAKEALIKAFGGAAILRWHDMEVVNGDSGDPEFRLHGALAELAAGRHVHVSMTHDAGVATAFVVVEAAS
ncbi:holo-ACP synthase [Agromyces atrinae]|uniref:holo-ACP synthase n=1 Tax=Agromyces atrinae TaxID=592376 RepID=UPI001F56EC19|nr:holo-ACP synthase [Agromyces atrinae]MCI2957851.1 holo-ACP synthase [Agromyces atrinae]